LSQANPVVVLFAGALGDFLLAVPALRLLRRRHAGRPLTLAVREPLVPLGARMGSADRTVRLDDVAMARFLGGGTAPPWWPEGPRLYGWFGADDPSIRGRLGAAAASAEFFRVVRGDGAGHAALEYLHGIGERRSWAEVVTLAALDRRPGAASPPTLVLHRGAGARAKRWGPTGFAHVAEWWRVRGGDVVDLVGPAEEDAPRLPGAESLRAPALSALADTLGLACAFVGNDSGPAHLAAACGVPGVVVFGPSDPERWRPLSAQLAVVRGDPATFRADGFDDPPARDVIGLLSGALP